MESQHSTGDNGDDSAQQIVGDDRSIGFAEDVNQQSSVRPVMEGILNELAPALSHTQQPTDCISMTHQHDVQSEIEQSKKERIELEHALFVSSEECRGVTNKLLEVNKLLDEQRRENEVLVRDRNQRMESMRELEAERDQFLSSKNECEQKVEILSRFKEDLEAKVERLNHDKLLLGMDVQNLNIEIAKLREKNCILESKIEDAAKEKLMIQYEKERWAQEKEIYLHNRDWFMNEIKERDTKFAVLRVEMIRCTGDLQAELASAAEKFDVTSTENKRLLATLENREKEISRLNERIKEVFEENAQKINKLEEELTASERLSAVYKEAAEGAENQLNQLKEDFDARGVLLKKSKDAYGTLCEKLDDQKKNHKEEVSALEVKLNDVNDELERANELLKAQNRLMLTDDEVAELSPAAAAASALIRSGISLTGIYREHCRVVAQLEEAKAENKRIENYFRQLVEDIEKKAPLLLQQRLSFEKVNEIKISLEKQLEEAGEEKQSLENARDATARELAYTRAELERYQRDCDDLSRQVRHLLHALEVTRGRESNMPSMSEEDRDILWNSIGELQRVNQKLLSDLRTTNANHEKEAEEANSEEVNRLKTSLDEAFRKLDLLKNQNSKQNSIIEELQSQRETLKKMSEGKKTEEESFVLNNQIHELETQVSILKMKAERAEKNLELFRDEKQQSDEILQNRIEQQYNLIAELRKTNGKFESDIEFQKQTQLLLKEQTENDANALEIAKERCTKLEENHKSAGKHAQKLQEELMIMRDELSKYKTNVEALTEHVTLLRSSEARLQMELQVTRESNYCNEKMTHVVQLLQSRLDHSDEQKVKQLEDQLSLAKNENESLKKFVSEISEQHRTVSLDLKMTVNKVATERDQALTSKKSAEDRLQWKNEEYDRLQAKYDEIMSQLNRPDSMLDSTADDCKKEAMQLRNRNSYLESRLKTITSKLEATEKRLMIREKELEDTMKMSNDIETALKEQTTIKLSEHNSLRSMLDLVNEQLSANVANVESQREEIARLEKQITDQGFKNEQIKMEEQRKITELEKQCTIVNVARANAESHARELELQISTITAEKNSVEGECSRIRMMVQNLEGVVHQRENELATLKQEASEIQAKLDEFRNGTSTEIAVLRGEKQKLEEQLKEADDSIGQYQKKFEGLNDNLARLSERTAFLERNCETSGQDPGSSERKTATALHDVIKYLQNENRQAIERTMNAELQWKRLQAQQANFHERIEMLEQENQKLRSETEQHIRSAAEKSEMIARLELMESVQKENSNLKNQIEKMTHRSENLAKNLSDLQVRVATLDAEKITDRGKLQNLISDLQGCRKELESWKERHAQALASLGKFGPEKVVTLTNEIETWKRKFTVVLSERDAAKKEMERLSEQSKASSSSNVDASAAQKLEEMGKLQKDLSARFEQARAFARQYRLKSQTLEKEVAALKSQKSALDNEEEESAETARMRLDLANAKMELEKIKQRLPQKVGWQTEQASASSPKTNTILQTQMKQIESLSAQNKELKGQLEELSNKFSQTNSKLITAENKLRAFQQETDTKEELRFRLSSITSLMAKKEKEVTVQRAEIEKLKKEIEEYSQLVDNLKHELSSHRDRGIFTAPMPLVPSTPKPVSTSTSLASQAGSVINEKSTTELSAIERITQAPSTVEMLLGESAASLASASHVGREPSPKLSREPSMLSGSTTSAPVSTTSDQSTVAVSTKAASLSRSVLAGERPEDIGSSSGHSQKGSDLISSQIILQQTAPQSNAISQSSASSALQASSMLGARPAQHHAVSGSGDGANVITSSVAPAEMVAPVVMLPTKTTITSATIDTPGPSRKRVYQTVSDQSSSIETESDVLEPQKKQRSSPTEQVSTSSRFLHAGDQRLARTEGREHILVTHDDDKAEQEQQDTVETTTNPEHVRQDTFYEMIRSGSNRARAEGNVYESGNEVEVIGDRLEEEGHDEEQNQNVYIMRGEMEREVSADEDELVEEGDEIMEELDEDFDDAEELDEEEDDGEILEYGRYGMVPSQSIAHNVVHEDEEDVILIQDDDEPEGSQSPADQSTDEAQGEVVIPIVSGDQQPLGMHRLELPSLRVGFDDERSRSEQGSSEMLLPAHLNQSASEVTAQAVDVVSGSGMRVGRSLSPAAGNVETGSGDASSSANRSVETDVDNDDSEPRLVIGIDEAESGNEIADEELADRIAAQTDDETGSPYESASELGRRLRIRYPDVHEATSSRLIHEAYPSPSTPPDNNSSSSNNEQPS